MEDQIQNTDPEDPKADRRRAHEILKGIEVQMTFYYRMLTGLSIVAILFISATIYLWYGMDNNDTENWESAYQEQEERMNDLKEQNDSLSVYIDRLQRELEQAKTALEGVTERSNENGNNENRETTHIVQPGESLWIIAERYLGNGQRYNELSGINKLENPDHLSVGQEILITQKE